MRLESETGVLAQAIKDMFVLMNDLFQVDWRTAKIKGQ